MAANKAPNTAPTQSPDTPKKAARGRPKGSTNGGNSDTYHSIEAIWTVLMQLSSPEEPLTVKRVYEEVSKRGYLTSESTVRRILDEKTALMELLYRGHLVSVQGKPACYYDGARLHLILDNVEEVIRDLVRHQAQQKKGKTQSSPISNTPSESTVGNILRAMLQADPALKTTYQLGCAEAITDPDTGEVYYDQYLESLLLEEGEKPSNKPRRYYLESLLSDSEWRALRDHVIALPGVNSAQMNNLLTAINLLRPAGYRAPNQDTRRVDYAFANSSHIYYVIDQLDHALRTPIPHKLRLTYGEYVLENGRAVLRQRKNAGLLDVEPHALLWANGNYYLKCKHKGTMHLRVDRIMKVEELPETFNRPEQLDPVTYRRQAPAMYAGKNTEVQLHCHTSLLNQVVDFFGNRPKYSEPDDRGYTEVTMNVIPDGVLLFALQYPDKVEVVKPKSLRKKVEKALQAGIETYGLCPSADC